MNITELIKADFRNVYRDPTLLAAAVAPLIFLIVNLLGVPFITSYIDARWGVDITLFHRIIVLFFVFIISMIYGMISAFIILDEKDEAIISFIHITPFSLSGYMLYRLGFAFLSSSFGVSILSITFLLKGDLSVFESFFLICIVPMESIFMALFIVSFAKNKVEGLALSKLVGIIPFSAIGAYLIVGNVKYLLAIFPPFWVIQAVEAEEFKYVLLFVFMSILIHLVYIKFLFKKFRKNILF